MNSFRNNRLCDHETPLNTVWLLNALKRIDEELTNKTGQEIRRI